MVKISTKRYFGVCIQNIIWKNTYVEQLKLLSKGYVDSKIAHMMIDSYYNEDIRITIQDSFNIPFSENN